MVGNVTLISRVLAPGFPCTGNTLSLSPRRSRMKATPLLLFTRPHVVRNRFKRLLLYQRTGVC